MKIQYFQMETKSVEVKEEKLIIEGYASTPDLDSHDDIVLPSAFVDTMKDHMNKPIVLLQHNWEKIIGKVTEYRIEEKGLWIKAEIFNNLDGCFNSIKEGLLGTFSIGFKCIGWNISDLGERRIREITKLELYENSIVTFPANKSATFTLAKSIKGFFEELEIKDLGKYKLETKGGEEEIVKEEEEKQEEPKNAESNEIVGENPNLVEEAKKEEELKALTEQVEALQKENTELKATLIARDEEILQVSEMKAKTEKELEEKEEQIKSYLGNGSTIETKSKTTFVKTWSYFNNL